MKLLCLGHQCPVLRVTQCGYVAFLSMLVAYRDPCLSHNMALTCKPSPLPDAQLEKHGSGPSLQEDCPWWVHERCWVLTLPCKGSLRQNVKGNFDYS